MRCQTLFESGNKTWFLFYPDAAQAKRVLDGNALAYRAGGEAVLVVVVEDAALVGGDGRGDQLEHVPPPHLQLVNLADLKE